MRRRVFMVRVTTALLGIPVVILSAGCGGGDDAAGSPDAGGGSFIITNQDDSGHAHELTVFCADLVAGKAVSYIATGPHRHTVMLTEAQVMMVAAGESVSISFTDGHSHTFVIARPEGTC